MFALTFMMIFGLVSLVSWLRAYADGRIVHGQTTRRLQAVLITMGALVSVMMMVMGVIRENGRQPYLIHGELTTQGQQLVNDPELVPPAQNVHR